MKQSIALSIPESMSANSLLFNMEDEYKPIRLNMDTEEKRYALLNPTYSEKDNKRI